MTEVEMFFEEIKEVCKRHNISISHEDGWGSFQLDVYKEELNTIDEVENIILKYWRNKK